MSDGRSLTPPPRANMYIQVSHNLETRAATLISDPENPHFFCTVISKYCNLSYLLLTPPKLDKFGKSKGFSFWLAMKLRK
jgi:hypothetical protein